jgi:hypothetical protein
MIDLCVGNAAADVMAKFRQDSAGLWYSPRLDEEIKKRAEHSEKQRKRALDGWEERRKKKKEKTHATANATALPLENEDVNENRIENKDRKEGVEEREGIIYPWPTETFKSAWSKWLRYLKKQHGKEHLTFDGEQLELRDLSQLAKTESEAIAIIDNCMAKTWKHIQKHERTSNNGGGAKGFPNPHGGKNTDSARRSADRKDFDTGGG